jgi:beta-xylosidase
MALTAFGWANSDAWAGQVIEHAGKFFYYVPMTHKTITGFALGVGVSDSPTGPFVDARGTALITNNMTPDTEGKTAVFSWDDIDSSGGGSPPSRSGASVPLLHP